MGESFREIGGEVNLGLAFHSGNVAEKQGRGRGHGGGAHERQGRAQGWRTEETEEQLHEVSNNPITLDWFCKHKSLWALG